MKKLPSFKNCFGCGKQNPIGLRLEILWDEVEEKAITFFSLSEDHTGFTNVIHGGIISTIFDEVLWWAIAAKLRKSTVTVRLCTNYKKPLEPNKRYEAIAWVEEVKGKKIKAKAIINDSEKNILAEAEGIFITLPDQMWRKFIDGLDDPSFFLQEN